MVRAFLYFIATMVVLVIAGMFALNIWSDQVTEFTFTPDTEFVEQDPLEDNAYNDPDMWYSRPGIGTNDPSRYQPAIAETQNPLPRSEDEGTLVEQASEAGSHRASSEDIKDAPPFAVFFVHPTSYIPTRFDGGEVNWNADFGNEEAEARADLFLRGLASPFNQAAEIWAPKYRQAHVGAFVTARPDGQRSIDSAYRDVAQAFDYFLESVDEDRPIVLAGHSQGSLHLLRLLRERVKGRDLENRIAAVYAVGWPISLDHDLPVLPLPGCERPNQAGCILSWASFADDGDPSQLLSRFRDTPGLDGEVRGDTPILCVNPITGFQNSAAPADDNKGTLVPDENLASGQLVAGAVGARCDEQGILRIGDPPAMGSAVLPGANYHVYDIPLFWRNLQEDVVTRVREWAAANS
ncbi:DUF3089 domain-containing protein [Alteriqipengyuania lutimaris]|uniref:DUF3089 domain-containing protein n=1 Tax=Alteriqipengyuania lutimaris TaxID=1538146 RepID=A0A395LL52_9SPHN|nr:DUF3089 domain-containing protein [Alteriqipengyuania lutimaris]MBB3033208.1 hypothetical protein [Alteriqipengyuania lutimaris]RDS77743.1 DUF3089 domain-containing protein [Alteriqipengyuania lutimaris]